MKKNLHSGGSCGEDRCHLDYNHYDSIPSYYYLDNLSVDEDTAECDVTEKDHIWKNFLFQKSNNMFNKNQRR